MNTSTDELCRACAVDQARSVARRYAVDVHEVYASEIEAPQEDDGYSTDVRQTLEAAGAPSAERFVDIKPHKWITECAIRLTNDVIKMCLKANELGKIKDPDANIVWYVA